MSIEEAIMGGIVFKGKKDKPQEDEKVKTKAKKATYIRGQHIFVGNMVRVQRR